MWYNNPESVRIDLTSAVQTAVRNDCQYVTTHSTTSLNSKQNRHSVATVSSKRAGAWRSFGVEAPSRRQLVQARANLDRLPGALLPRPRRSN